MIAYFHGKLIWAENQSIIISANGVGYEVNYFNEFTNSDLGKDLTIFVSHKISEYGQVLFGFNSIEEKIIFEELDNIKGVGSKIIFTIMGALQINNWAKLQTLKLDDLTKISGVGKSTAQKLLLGVSTKLKKDFDITGGEVKVNNKDIEKKYSEVISMLEEWGIKKKNLLEFFGRNDDMLDGKPAEKIIEYTLKNLK